MMTSPRDAAAAAVAAAAARAEKPRRLHIPTVETDAARVRAMAPSMGALGAPHDALKNGNLPTATTTSLTANLTAATARERQDADMRSQTCVEFLHIMKEFSESSCDASEMVQRVDSLVNQDEQLLRLFPLSRKQADANAMANRQDEKEDEAALRLRRALADDDDELDISRIETSATTGEMTSTGSAAMETDDHTTAASSNEKELDAQDELQRWMDLDLVDLDHHMDVFDFQQDHHSTLAVEPSTLSTADRPMPTPATTTSNSNGAGSVAPTASPFTKRGSSGFFRQTQRHVGGNSDAAVSTAAGFLRGQGVANAPQKSLVAAVKNSCSPLSKKSVTAALFDDDDEEDNDLELVLGGTSASSRLLSGPPLKRAKLSRPTNTHALHLSVLREQESKSETDDESTKEEEEEGNVWGMENDGYEQDLLSSIDHAVLCDRENRFLQWDLEMATQQQQHQQQEQQRRLLVNSLTRNPAPSSAALTSAAPRGRANSGVSVTTSSAMNRGMTLQTHRAPQQQQQQQKVMASSPRSSKSPSNVDIVDDWNSLDFGTFQNRTVSHILSSCLHKRKLHHPYKNQIQLVNFNVPGRGPDGDVSSAHGPGPHQLGGSLATSLAFGGQQQDALAASGGSALGGFVPLLASGRDGGMGLDTLAGGLKSPAKGDKKTPKKREERKRLMTLKMQETFADLEGTFTEQDLDVKGIVGPGASLSKMALSKLENLPLPDLTNLPQDLRELKRKIEATEHKVEGTKHRHRKGGPCPRCQVQNQLRAAKRAYHKRAVAHKKLPHVVVNAVNEEAQEAADAQPRAAPVGSISMGTESSLDLSSTSSSKLAKASNAAVVTTSSVPRKGTGAVVSPSFTASSRASKSTATGSSMAKPRTALSGVASLSPGTTKQQQMRLAVSSVSSPSSSLCSSASSVATTATVGSTSGSSSSSSSSVSPPPPSATSSFHSRTRGPCGKAASSAMPFSSPSSASASPASTSSPSSPETASPQLQHVTVSSA
ncbi:hypothetical protein BBJ28_00019796 [Nothophytophthora sp. Chile5]|nr:hypothetical protein BBJ28_00019796 [Nothophytophthora sp. Chile5]